MSQLSTRPRAGGSCRPNLRPPLFRKGGFQFFQRMAQAGRAADVDVDVDVFGLRVDDLSFFPGGGAVYQLVVQRLPSAGAVFAYGGEAV